MVSVVVDSIYILNIRRTEVPAGRRLNDVNVCEQMIGPKLDHKPAREYILKRYLDCNNDPDRMCYSHFTVATGVNSSNWFCSRLEI